MKADKDLWQRLTRLARLAPPSPDPAMPLGFDTRVLAAWRESRAAAAAPYWELVFRRVLITFTLLMIISLAANLLTAQRPDADDPIEMSQSFNGYLP